MSDLTHVQRIRQEMPATTVHVYLNTGTFGPLPTCVVEAMQKHMQDTWRDGRLGAAAFETMGNLHKDARSKVARLLHADENEIALTDNTGEGMNIISYGFNWHEGDEVITTNHEHVSALAPLYQIRNRYGVIVRNADLGPATEHSAHSAIAGMITPRTRLIVLSHVTWTTGAVLDIAEVSRVGHEHNIPVLIDGAQSAGSIPLDVKALDVDFYAIPMQKWLCGPDGTGALYVRKESLSYAAPTYVGYWSIKHEEGQAEEFELQDCAQRFEVGGRQTAAIAGQCAVLGWLEETVGHQWMFERIRSLNNYAYHALQTISGVNMLTPRPGTSGLVSFLLEGHDVKEVVKELREQHNIYIRDIPSTKSLRISTGFYNTEEDIDRLVEALQKM